MGIPLRKRERSTEIQPEEGREVVVAGWLQEVRDVGAVAFAILRDSAGTLQIVLPKKRVSPEIVRVFLETPRESVVAVRGSVRLEPQARNGYEVVPSEVEILSQAAVPLPLGVVDRVRAELETRLDHRYLDLRKPPIAAIFRIRSTLVHEGIDSFRRQGFVQVHTPRIIGSASEGGTDLFEVTYFEKKAYLSQSPQLYKQMLMATSLERVFEVATYFRAEKHNTPRHLNEITAFDAELSFIESEEEVMEVLERVIRDIWEGVVKRCSSELQLLGVSPKIPSLPFRRITYDEAREIALSSGEVRSDLPWGEDLPAEAERAVGRELERSGSEFYFITRYPESAKPFYVYVEEGSRHSRSFDLAHRGIEITSGAQREHRYERLLERIRSKGLDPRSFESYLLAFRYGMPPHGGFGLGIDRLTMELLELPNVREAVLFPRDRSRITP